MDLGRGQPPAYRPRIADQELAWRLEAAGAVGIEGPRVCGKTTTARQAAASEILMDADPRVRDAMAVDPRLLLAGPSPRLIDEWQTEPAIWNHVRRAVDDRPGLGHFILTGSAIPADDTTRHTGAGRISRLRLRPMSLFELRRSTGRVSLKRLMNGEPVASGTSEQHLADVAELICVGGWPGHLRRNSIEAAMIANEDYLGEICRVDIARAGGTGRDPERVNRFMQSLARNTATVVSVARMVRDAQGSDAAFTEQTARSYLSALERLMVVEQQPALGTPPAIAVPSQNLAQAALRGPPRSPLRL